MQIKLANKYFVNIIALRIKTLNNFQRFIYSTDKKYDHANTLPDNIIPPDEFTVQV